CRERVDHVVEARATEDRAEVVRDGVADEGEVTSRSELRRQDRDRPSALANDEREEATIRGRRVRPARRRPGERLEAARLRRVREERVPVEREALERRVVADDVDREGHPPGP